jgi:hypothetical protein
VTKSHAAGQLFSIDALRGRDLVPAARAFLKSRPKQEGGFSTWDASHIFFELEKLNVEDLPSARTLLLLYAADLRFRLRWDILPALEEGQVVVAVPYVETGMAFGLAMGLPDKWLTEVFRFAPAPVESFWVNRRPARAEPSGSGFLEFCSEILPENFYDKFAAHFDELRTRAGCKLLQL